MTPERDATANRPRSVVSFVRRGDRMTALQAKAWAEHRDSWVIDVPTGERSTALAPDAAPLDLPAIFGRDAELFVEVGSGKGDSPVAFAAAHPDANVLAFEVFLPGAAATVAKIADAGLTNLRLISVDAADALAPLLPPASVAELRVFFPDPWHKTRHHKRRLVNPAFADDVARVLAPGGRWLVATDWADYADHCREVLGQHPSFVDAYPDATAPRDPERPLTAYEQRGIRQGREITDLVYRRDA